jgi:flagellar basal body P-ring protein FlgI
MPHAAKGIREAIEEIQMKNSFGFALMLVLFAAPAFAGNKPATVVIPQNVQVGSTQLAAGQYELTVTGSGSNVQASLVQNKKTVVTFSAKMVDEKGDASVETDSQGGTTTLHEIRTGKFSLILGDGTQTGQ